MYAIENDIAMSRLNNLIRSCSTVRAEIFELPIAGAAAKKRGADAPTRMLTQPASVFYRAVAAMFPGDWRVGNHMAFTTSSAAARFSCQVKHVRQIVHEATKADCSMLQKLQPATIAAAEQQHEMAKKYGRVTMLTMLQDAAARKGGLRRIGVAMNKRRALNAAAFKEAAKVAQELIDTVFKPLLAKVSPLLANVRQLEKTQRGIKMRLMHQYLSAETKHIEDSLVCTGKTRKYLVASIKLAKKYASTLQPLYTRHTAGKK